LTGVVSGMAPLLGTGIGDLATTMKAGDRGGSGGAQPRRLRSLLVGGEVALSLVLLVAAGLLLRSFLAMQAVSWGFTPEKVAVMRVSLMGKEYENMAARRVLLRRLLAELPTQPGFDSVATSTDKIGQSWMHVPFTPEEFVPATPQEMPNTNFHNVSPDYFRTLGIPVVQGRAFTENDTHDTAQVAIIDAAIAQRFFPNGDALGKRIRTKNLDRNAEIVGIVGGVKFDGPEASRLPDMYIPSLQVTSFSFYVYVRTSLDVATAGRTIREVLRNIDAGLATAELGNMTQSIARPAALRGFPLVLLAGFSALALVLAVVGIYAVTAYGVAQRTREIGIRMALGAQAASVTALVLRQSFRPIAAGMLAGIAGAAVTALAMRNLLFGIDPMDATTFAIVPPLLATIALLACILPAHRATKVDPLIALRTE
jgi:putative ABC transport system permease protein